MVMVITVMVIVAGTVGTVGTVVEKGLEKSSGFAQLAGRSSGLLGMSGVL